MDQTKTRGLTLALNSLDNALKMCEGTKSGAVTSGIAMAIIYINAAKRFLDVEIEASQQQPTVFVGEERRTK